MFFSTDNMSNVHQRLINNNGIVISRNSVGFNDNEITDIIGIKNDIAAYHIAYQNLLISRHTETYGRFTAFCFISSNLLWSQITAFAHIARHFAFFNQCLTFFFQFFVSAVAIISFAFCKQFFSILFVDIQSFSLTIRTIFAAYINTFIPVHTQPF